MEDIQTPEATAREFPVVGIGASAGGVTALRSLFTSIPKQPNLAFVVIQHALPDHKSQLVPVLAKWTALPVIEVADGMKLECNAVFVAPPSCALTLDGDTFVVRPIDGTEPRVGIDTIDWFLDSLARNLGPRAIAVVLSGTGADGAAGAVSIKRAGGIVLVQDPKTAMNDGMPHAAIDTGAADHILSLDMLARELIACASPSYVRSPVASWADDVTRAFNGIIELIRTKAKFDLTGYKTTPLLWRIQGRMQLRRVMLFRDYEALLHDDPAELEALIRAIPIHVTQFFRDTSAWELLEQEVIPRLFEEAGGVPIRAWTAACATGEEAYSLAMVLAEHAGAREGRADFQMFATDTSAEIVARASRGVFNARAVDVLSPQRRHRFFYSADSAFRVKRNLREKMVFAPQDLLADPPFPGLDLVSCRNLLIYLEPDAAKRVVFLLHSSLRIGGYLFLGSAESLAYQQPGFEELVPNQRIYRKTGPISDVNIDFPKRPLRMRKSESTRRVIGAHAGQSSRAQVDLPADADDAGEILTSGGNDAHLTEALRLSHEELDSSREELQALNEELRASNDQLNIANEEITRANAQLRGKVTELETQSDVLSSGAVTALFLDEQLRIRWFTRAVDKLFPALTSDTGRYITDLAPKFDDPAFIADAQSVMQTGEPREAEILTVDGRWYLKCVRPFRTGGKAGLGVAITFTDVTDRKAAETVLRKSEAALSAELEAMTRLHDFSAAILDTRTAQELVDLALDAVIGLHRADFGNVQLYDAQAGVLRIAAQRGFDNWFLEHFAQVDARHVSACGQAFALGERVSFEDIETEKSAESFRAAATRAGFRAVQSTPLTAAAGTPLGMISTHFCQPRRLTDVEHRLTDIVAHALSLAIERVRAEHALSEREQALQRNQALLRAQKEAFQSAMNGAPLATSLEILVRVVVQQFQGECRSAFYISDRKGTGLHHVVGMSDSYAQRVDGFQISPESLACNLTVATGEPVVTPDVFEEPRWQPWIWLAREYDYRACWSFPVEILSGKLVGSLAMYFREPRAPTPRDYEFAAAITQTAAIIIFRHQERDERGQAGAAPESFEISSQ